MTKSVKNTTILGASLTLLMATLGLIGYLPGLELLGRGQKNLIPMAPSTAVLFLLQGLIVLRLAFYPWKRQLSTLILMVIAALTALFGLLEIPGQLTGLDLNFEDRLVPEAGKLGEIPIARMSSLTGTLFFLTGVAIFLLLLRSYSLKDRGAHDAGILGSLAFFGSFVAALGYMIGTPLLYGQGATIPIALTTALAFLWLTFAVIAAAGQNSVPLQFFAGASTRALLMRAFLPIATVTILIESLAALYVPTLFPVNPVFIVSITVASAIVILGVIVSRVSAHIGHDIDQAQGALAKVPSEDPHPVMRIGTDGTVLLANSAARPLLEERDVGQTAPAYWKKLTADVLERGEVKKNVEIEHEGKILSFTGVPVPEGDYVNLYGLDVTERKRAEEQIKNLAKFPSENPYPVLRIAGDGTVLFTNSAAQPLLEGGDVGHVAPDYWKNLSADVLERGEVKRNVEIEHEGKILSFTGVPVPEGDYVNLYGLDVTERKRAEEQIQNLAKFPAENPSPVLRIAKDGTVLFANSAAQPLLDGADVGQVAPDYWKQLSTEALKIGEVKKNVEIEHEGKILSFTGVPVPEGDYVNLYGLDVTERKTAKQFSDALNEINNDINSTLDFDQIMQEVAIEATKTIGAEACGIVLRESDSWCLHYVYGFPQDIVETKFTDEELSHIVLAAQTKRPVVVNDALNDRRVDRELMAGYGVKSLLTIPLLGKKEVFGAIVFSYQSDPVAFTDLEIDFAEKLGVSLSLAIQNARSHEITEQSLTDTEALRRMAGRFTQSLELDEILDTGFSEISTALGIKHGCVYIFDASGNLAIKKQEQLNREFLEAKTIISAREGCTGQAVATQKVFAPTPEEHDYICEDSKRLLDLDCLAAIPIMTKGNVLGVIELFAPAHRRLTDRERRIVTTMVDQLSSAIDNANLYSKERNIANTLQETLLTVPEKIEGISFGHLYRSATVEAARAGGDFFDLFELEHEKVGIVIGDVSGKGLTAATLTSLVKNTIKAYAYQHKSPGEVVALTNNVVEKASAASMFVTLCFGVLDKQSGVFTYCSAGHPPGILRRRSGKTRVLETKNPVIGVFPDLNFIDDTVTVETGDVLVLYTDGVIEARRQKELLGEERLVRIIKGTGGRQPNEIPNLILDEVVKFGKTLADDVGILALSLDRLEEAA